MVCLPNFCFFASHLRMFSCWSQILCEIQKSRLIVTLGAAMKCLRGALASFNPSGRESESGSEIRIISGHPFHINIIMWIYFSCP